MNDIEATKIITVLQSAFPHPVLTKDRFTLYQSKLRPLDFKAATLAVDALTDDLNFFPTVKELKAAIEAATPPAPALPTGQQRDALQRYIFRIYDADLDDYVELPEPVPFGDPRCPGLIDQDRAAIRLAGERKRENALREQSDVFNNAA